MRYEIKCLNCNIKGGCSKISEAEEIEKIIKSSKGNKSQLDKLQREAMMEIKNCKELG